jgi:hypothetical protein
MADTAEIQCACPCHRGESPCVCYCPGSPGDPTRESAAQGRAVQAQIDAGFVPEADSPPIVENYDELVAEAEVEPFLPSNMALCERCLTTWTYRSNDAPTTCPECGAEGLIPPEGNVQ